MKEKELARYLSSYDGEPIKLMEVCGTHTSSLYRTGIRQLLSTKITLLSGPGCPVCVTPTAYIDKLISYALKPGHKVMAFGDLLAVPGSEMSLAGARDRGGQVDFFYNPEEIFEIAAANPETTYILAAVGCLDCILDSIDEVAHHKAVEIPFTLQHRAQKILAVAALDLVIEVIGAHDRSRAGIDAVFEMRQEHLAFRPLIRIDTYFEAGILHLVEGIVLHAGHDIFILYAAHQRRAHPADSK